MIAVEVSILSAPEVRIFFLIFFLLDVAVAPVTDFAAFTVN